jgi:dihydroneopterin aldolase
MGKISLEGMEFFAYHGCFHEEQLIGTKFSVDLSVDADTSLAETGDHLHDAINYTGLYHIVKTEMEIRSHLLEHVASRIISSVVEAYPAIEAMEVKISKLNPPVGGKMKQVSFGKTWKR